MINSPLFSQVETALQNRESFCAEGQNVTVIHKASLLSRLIHYVQDGDSAWFAKNAFSLEGILYQTPNDGSSNAKRVIASVKSFLKQYSHLCNTDEFKCCERGLLAYRLKIPVTALDERINPGFAKFAKENHLQNMLMTHNHELLVKNNIIFIKHQKKYIPWNEAKVILDSFPKDNTLNEPYALSLYGRTGIQCENRYNWTELKPFLQGNTAKWAKHFIKDPLIFDEEQKGYLMQFCSSATEKAPRLLSGDHSWIRLYSFTKTDQKIIGEMYSIGLYRPHKHGSLSTQPCQAQRGYITQDISEEWGINDEIKTLTKRISKISFDAMITKIKQDKQANNTIYQVFDLNCDRYICDLAKLDGVELPTRRHFLELFTCAHLVEGWKERVSKFSKPVRLIVETTVKIVKAIVYLLTPFFNALLFVLGARSINFFDINNLYISSPWVLANPVRDAVNRWRWKEINKIDLDAKDPDGRMNELYFAFPEKL